MDTQSLTNNTYKTEIDKVSLIARLFPGFIFYSRLFGILLSQWWSIKKGVADSDSMRMAACRVIKTAEKSGLNVHIKGIDNLQKHKEPVVFIANHMSTFETLLLPCMLQAHTDLSFVVKDSLLSYPIFGLVLKKFNPISLSQTNPKADLKLILSESKQRIKSGSSILIFPQGKRTLNFNRKKFNSMGIKIAKNSGTPVIPIALKTDAWEPGKILPDFGRINPEKSTYFTYGEPVIINDKGKIEHEQVLDFIENNLEDWECIVTKNSYTRDT
jgi:1-acyl-sn-glycerol-3-phosphate acyltransferase